MGEVWISLLLVVPFAVLSIGIIVVSQYPEEGW